MKDKIIAFITLGSIFSLFFYYKIDSPKQVNVSTINDSISSEQIVEKLVNEINKDNQLSESEEVIFETLNKEECNLNEIEANELSFDSAFKYYRNCKGKDEQFVWNDNKYTTKLSTEIVKSPSFVMDDENNQIDKKVDDYHYQLQKEMIGVSLEKK